MRTFPPVALATLGDSFQSFFDAVDDFVSNLASVRLVPLVLALVLFTAYLSLRARASYNILRAAYPTERFQFREIWGSYFAGYGFNAVIPARGGDVVRLFLTKTSIPNSSYPAVAASFVTELGFDVAASAFRRAPADRARTETPARPGPLESRSRRPFRRWSCRLP